MLLVAAFYGIAMFSHKQLEEDFFAESRLTNDRGERAARHFFSTSRHNGNMPIGVTILLMASFLGNESKTILKEDFDYLLR